MATNKQARLKEAADLHSAGKLAEAETIYRELLEAKFRRADIKHLLGVARVQQGAVEEGVSYIREAVKAKPRAALVHNHLANALMQLHRHEEALSCYRRALALNPKMADVLSNLGNVLLMLGDCEGAVKACRKALKISPKLAEGQLNLSLALEEMGLLKESAVACDRALRVSSSYPKARSQRASLAMRMCDWKVVEELQILKGVEGEENNIMPLSLLALSDDPLLQRKAAEAYLKGTHADQIVAGTVARPIARKRLRIAYLSADFHDHAVMHLCVGMFEHHDREAFEVHALSVGPETSDEMRARLLVAFEKFWDLRTFSDHEIAERIRELGIDVLVDLAGLTRNHRVGVLARRVAAVQVNYMGYPGTTGSSCHDYIIADGVVIPEGAEEGYSEKVLRLPGCYLATDDKREIGPVPARNEVALPEKGFVFCSINGSQKISRATFGSWMRILEQVPESVLWLFKENDEAVKNLRGAAEEAGVSAERLIFAPRVSAVEHLGRLRRADLYLDTFPYTGHATMADVLFVGVPGVTLMGESFASRVAGSLLRNLGMEELVTEKRTSYERLAVELATDSGRLAELKKRLMTRAQEGGVFDTQSFTKEMEAAYRKMWADLEPEKIG